MNLIELPAEVLLNVFGKADREENKLDLVKTKLRLVCHRFNQIITNPFNQKQLESIRTRVNEITIAQIGFSHAFRVVAYGNELIDATPNVPSLKRPKHPEESIHDKWISLVQKPKDYLTASSNEFFAKFAETVATFETDLLQFSNILLTRSFISSLILALGNRTRIATLDFNICYSEKCGLTEFSSDVDDILIGKLASNFKCVSSIPNNFVTSEFIEKWTEGDERQNLSLEAVNSTKDVIKNQTFKYISLRHFARIGLFNSIGSVTTLAELVNAFEARIRQGTIERWDIALSDDEMEIQRFLKKNAKDYHRVVNRPDIRRFGMKKYFYLNGMPNALAFLINWNDRIGMFVVNVGTRPARYIDCPNPV